MDRKIITVEEFFRLKEMFNASKEDQQIAWEIFDSQYEDKIIISHLMAKALMFKSRRNFIDTVKFEFIADSKKLYSFIDINTFDKIYMDILNKLLDD